MNDFEANGKWKWITLGFGLGFGIFVLMGLLFCLCMKQDTRDTSPRYQMIRGNPVVGCPISYRLDTKTGEIIAVRNIPDRTLLFYDENGHLDKQEKSLDTKK
jgi:hypothetical protein